MKRITRAALEVEELPPVEVTKLRRNKKKVKFEDLVEVETKITQNLSAPMVSDEGINMTFSPIPESLSTTILKPRHPLPHSWTFWYSSGYKRLSWKQDQKISSVATIEDFWLTYDQVKLARLTAIAKNLPTARQEGKTF